MSLYQLVCDAHILSDKINNDISKQLESVFNNQLLPIIKKNIITNALLGINFTNIKEYFTFQSIDKFNYDTINLNNIIIFNIKNFYHHIDIKILDELIINNILPDTLQNFLNNNIDKEFFIKKSKITKIINEFGSFTNSFYIDIVIEWDKPII
jgi:hypothetical protein